MTRPRPIHPDGPTRPPTRYVASIAWRWTQIGIYLAITAAPAVVRPVWRVMCAAAGLPNRGGPLLRH